MHPTAARFAELVAEQHGLDVEVHEFPEGTKTAADAARAVGCELGQIAKSVVMAAGDDLVVVLTSGEHRVDPAKLADHVGVPATAVEAAAPEAVKRQTGWSIGGVPPCCHEHPTTVLLDSALLEYDTVWAAAGTPDAVFPLAPETLREVSGAEPADVFE